MIPPNSGREVAKKPNKTDKLIITNKSQNQMFLSFRPERPKIKKIPLRNNKRTNKKDASPNP